MIYNPLAVLIIWVITYRQVKKWWAACLADDLYFDGVDG